jgi:hypothetical protein
LHVTTQALDGSLHLHDALAHGMATNDQSPQAK